MSYIDMFKHKEVGCYIGEIPLYLTLEDITGEDFQCEKNQFVIGGGGGEHPAMVVKDINMAVLIYLIQFKDDDEAHDLATELYDDYSYAKAFDNLEAFFWTIRNYFEFFESAEREGYDKDKTYHLEVWVNGKVGDIAFRNFPELINPDILKIANKYLNV